MSTLVKDIEMSQMPFLRYAVRNQGAYFDVARSFKAQTPMQNSGQQKIAQLNQSMINVRVS